MAVSSENLITVGLKNSVSIATIIVVEIAVLSAVIWGVLFVLNKTGIIKTTVQDAGGDGQ